MYVSLTLGSAQRSKLYVKWYAKFQLVPYLPIRRALDLNDHISEKERNNDLNWQIKYFHSCKEVVKRKYERYRYIVNIINSKRHK